MAAAPVDHAFRIVTISASVNMFDPECNHSATQAASKKLREPGNFQSRQFPKDIHARVAPAMGFGPFSPPGGASRAESPSTEAPGGGMVLEPPAFGTDIYRVTPRCGEAYGNCQASFRAVGCHAACSRRAYDTTSLRFPDVALYTQREPRAGGSTRGPADGWVDPRLPMPFPARHRVGANRVLVAAAVAHLQSPPSVCKAERGVARGSRPQPRAAARPAARPQNVGAGADVDVSRGRQLDQRLDRKMSVRVQMLM